MALSDKIVMHALRRANPDGDAGVVIAPVLKWRQLNLMTTWRIGDPPEKKPAHGRSTGAPPQGGSTSGSHANRPQANGSQANGSQANRSQANGSVPIAAATPGNGAGTALDPDHAGFYMAQASIAGVEAYFDAVRSVIIPEVLRHDLDLDPDSDRLRDYVHSLASFDVYRLLIALWKESHFIDEDVRRDLSLNRILPEGTFSIEELASLFGRRWANGSENISPDEAENGQDVDALEEHLQRTVVVPLSRAGYLERVIEAHGPLNGAPSRNGAKAGGRGTARLQMTEKFHRFMVTLHMIS